MLLEWGGGSLRDFHGLSAGWRSGIAWGEGIVASDVQPRPIRKIVPSALSAAERLLLLISGALPQRKCKDKNSCEHDFCPYIFSG